MFFNVSAGELGFSDDVDGQDSSGGPGEKRSDGTQPNGGPPPVTIEPISLFPRGPFYRNPKLCFVLMPFTQQFALQEVYEEGIRPGIMAAGLDCRRADDIVRPGTIIKQIWQSIMEARFVVADLTDANGNVLYELGMAHVIGHEVILLTQSIDWVPYDLRQQRHIIYGAPTKRGIEHLRDQLQRTLEDELTR